MTEGSLADLGEGGVAVSDVISDSKDLHPGDTLALVLGDGTPVETTVAAVYDRALGFGDLTLPYDLLSAHVDNPLADTVLVATTLSDGELTAALAGHPGLSVKGSGHVADALAEQRQNGAQVAFLAMGLVLAFTTIAAVNTLAMATADRRREFALLRKVGTTRRQVLRMLRLESLTVAITAVLIGSAISLAVLTGFSAGMTGEAAPAPAAVPYLLVAAGVTALALIATSLPGRFSLRTAG
ncbi:ABC transporter permease [Streptomyces sp. RFCAC02]|uniref:ABC transporter permease n=1 Tax=Streptomyces sp. RFCAC02 TaxID=2499143 RepID=UPI00320AC57D